MIEPTQIQILVLCAALAQVVFEYFLKRANERHLWAMRNEPPPESGDLMNRETWAKATDYSLAKSRFASVEDAFGFVLFVGVFLYLFPFAFSEANWKTEVSMEASPWLCAFVVTVFLTALQIPSLFFDWRKQFSLEEKFGFNKSTKGLWVVDKIKGSILGFAFSLLLLALMIWL